MFTYDETRWGSLEPGKYADLAVLSDDYFMVPVEKVGELHSVLTLVGGKPVYGEGAFAALEVKQAARLIRAMLRQVHSSDVWQLPPEE
jgi:hypothetical protein